MDDYNNTTTYSSALDRIEETQNAFFKRAKSIFMVTYVIGLGALIISCVVMYLMDKSFVFFLIPIISIPFVVFVVLLSVKARFKNKIVNEVINLEIVRLYNMENDTNLEYQYHPKVTKEFNVNMGLFTKYASVSTKYRITGNSKEHMKFEMIYCSMITSNGKTSTVHFDGIYIRLFMKNKPIQQIRSKGKPHKSGTKMIQQEQYEERVFIPEDKPNTLVDTILLGIFRDIPSTFDVSAYYVASNLNEVHIAITPKEKNKLPETFDYTSFQVYAEPLMNYITFVYEAMTKLEDAL